LNSTESNPTAGPWFVPLNPGVDAALPACVVVISHAGNRIVPVIRTTALATAYLGALCDAQRRPFEWVELWFPHDHPESNGSAPEATATRSAHVARWLDLVRQWERSPGSGLVKLGWESGLPRPLVLQANSLSWVPFTDPETSRPLSFCREDAQLLQAGLPQASSHTHVFLSSDGRGFFQAAGNRTAPSSRTLDELLPAEPSLIALSKTGAGMAARRIAPLTISDFSDVLSGTTLTLEAERQETVRLSCNGTAGGVAPDILENVHRSLLRGRAGRNEWTAEIIALKMRAFTQALERVAEAVAVTHEPFLSLSEYSFAVRFGHARQPLQLWDFEVFLHATPCAAIRQAGGAKYAWRAKHETQMPPAYERRSADRQIQREVECRLRLVTRQETGVLIEATLARCPDATGGMLACLHLPLAGGRQLVWGRLSRDSSLARDETRFRSFPAEFDGSVTAELERTQGFVWSDVLLEIIPAAGFGEDFHSLGVLAVRLLLTTESRQLPAALDAVFSVIETVRAAAKSGPLVEQLRAAFDHEPRFRELLHPGRAVTFPIAAGDAIASLGESTWWELLAFILRLFPTDLPGAFCRTEESTDLTIFERVFGAAGAAAEMLNRRLIDQVMPHETMNARVRAVTASLRRVSGV
jgi:hypothetical protein